MIIQIDGKYHSEFKCDCFPISAVVIPGKIINLLTKIPHPDDQVTVTQECGITTIKAGKNVDLSKIFDAKTE